MIELNRILFATDFSKNSSSARDYACALADAFNADLHVLTVVQDTVLVTPDTGEFLQPASSLEEARESAERALDQVFESAWEQERSVIKSTRTGVPHVEIVRYARDQKIDLIVVGTHGRTGLSHAILGSVAERVVQMAGCPVLTVRATGHQFVMP